MSPSNTWAESFVHQFQVAMYTHDASVGYLKTNRQQAQCIMNGTEILEIHGQAPVH